MVESLHKRSFITGFLRVLSWAQYSLFCTHSHFLTSFVKENVIITHLLTTLNITNHLLHLTLIHCFTISSSVLIPLGVGWLAIDWSQTMIKLKLLWLDLIGGSACHRIAIWELAVMIFPSTAMSKASGFALMLPCLWQSILTTLRVQCILRSEELAPFAVSWQGKPLFSWCVPSFSVIWTIATLYALASLLIKCTAFKKCKIMQPECIFTTCLEQSSSPHPTQLLPLTVQNFP